MWLEKMSKTLPGFRRRGLVAHGHRQPVLLDELEEALVTVA